MTLAALLTVGALGAVVGCGPDRNVAWICLHPATGKKDGMIHDANHHVNGVADPCHCDDPCGPDKSCPIVVDPGPPGPACDASP